MDFHERKKLNNRHVREQLICLFLDRRQTPRETQIQVSNRVTQEHHMMSFFAHWYGICHSHMDGFLPEAGGGGGGMLLPPVRYDSGESP